MRCRFPHRNTLATVHLPTKYFVELYRQVLRLFSNLFALNSFCSLLLCFYTNLFNPSRVKNILNYFKTDLVILLTRILKTGMCGSEVYSLCEGMYPALSPFF